MNGHAPKGGCIGVNGEFYEGGKFLPSNPHRPKGTSSSYGSGLREIEPCVWETYKGVLKRGEKADGFYHLLTADYKVNYYLYQGGTLSEYEEFIRPYKEAWDAGKRWRVLTKRHGSQTVRFE